MRSVTLVCLHLFPLFVYAQLLHNYQPIVSSGKIPDEFLSSSTAKYELQRKDIRNVISGFERKARDRFYLESNFYVDALMLSGKVLFNDPMGKYINLVADELLKAHPALRRNIRFYVVKSPVANAFATERGSIFINIGLIARLANEAQLAFVMAHEIIHFTQGHAIDNYVVAQYVDDEEGAYNQASRYEKMFVKSHYSQEQELDADAKGMELFMTSKYRASAAPSLMNVLKDISKPTNYLTSQLPAFLNPYLSEKAYLQLMDASQNSFGSQSVFPSDTDAKARKTAPRPTETQAFSQHPTLQERKNRLQQILIQEGNQGYYFIRTKRQFQICREIARFELCQLYLEQTAYKDALYQIHTLIAQYPEELYLKLSLAKALYGMTKYRLEHKAYKHSLKYDNISASDLQLLQVVERLTPEKLGLIALTYIWNLQKETSQIYLDYLISDLLLALVSDFDESESLLDKWAKTIWKQLKSEPEFVKRYDQAQKEYAQNYVAFLYDQTREGHRKKIKAKKKLQQKGYQLDVDTLVVFGPVYYRIDKREKHESPIQLVASEQQQARFYHLIRNSARKLNIKLYLLDSRSLRERDPASHFNDIARLYAWHEEWLRHGDMDIICSNYDQVLPLVKRYGTAYFAHMGAFSMRDNFAFMKLLVAIPTLAAPPVWPVFAYLAIRPNEASFFYTWVYDLQKHKRIMHHYNRMKMKTNETVLQSNIYFDLWQIQRKKKKNE